MKNFIVSIICLLALIIPWSIYDRYASSTVENCSEIIESRVVPAIESGDWRHAEKEFSSLTEKWDALKVISAYFIGAQTINEVDCFVTETSCYIALQDDVNAVAATTELKCKLVRLHKDQDSSFDNIF